MDNRMRQIHYRRQLNTLRVPQH